MILFALASIGWLSSFKTLSLHIVTSHSVGVQTARHQSLLSICNDHGTVFSYNNYMWGYCAHFIEIGT